MLAADVRTLVDYNYWAYGRLFEAVAKLSPDEFTKPMNSSFSSVRDTLVHLHGADFIWYARINGESPTAFPKPDEFTDLAAVRAAWSGVEMRFRALTKELDDTGIMRVIPFKMFAGDAGSAPIAHIIQHVVNHGTYHRGQVTTMVRQLGAEPPKSIDLIWYYMERGEGLIPPD